MVHRYDPLMVYLMVVSHSDDADASALSALDEDAQKQIRDAFIIGDDRTFDEDPRYGLVALSQIAGRAMSPAINDPGTVIDILATYARLFDLWCQSTDESESECTQKAALYQGVAVPRLSLDAMFEDAFGAIGRDAAANEEVAVRLQTVIASLASTGYPGAKAAARKQATIALERAEASLQIDHDLKAVREASIASTS